MKYCNLFSIVTVQDPRYKDFTPFKSRPKYLLFHLETFHEWNTFMIYYFPKERKTVKSHYGNGSNESVWTEN